MHSIPLEEDDAPSFGAVPPVPQVEVEVLGDLRGHRLAGRYVLVELLGSGELGCAYAGRDDATGQPVTAKVLAFADHREVVTRVAERARQRFGVRHPAVAAVLAEGNLGGLWYGVMEDAPGKNFYHVQGDPRLDGPGLPAVALQLVEGLVALHGAGAVHGAISPGNVVWGEAGARLVDLDLSLAQETGGHGSGEEPSAAADVRALAGVLLDVAGGDEHEALADRFAAIARGEVRLSAAEWAAELRRTIAPPVPALFEEAVARAAAPSPVELAAEPVASAGGAAEDVAPVWAVAATAAAGSAADASELSPETAAPELAREAAELAREAAAPGSPLAADLAAPAVGPFGPVRFEPVRATIAGDDEDEDWGAAAPGKKSGRGSLGLIVGLVAVAVLAVIGWRWQAGAQTREAPVEAPPAEPAKRSERAAEAPTLANVAAAPGGAGAEAVEAPAPSAQPTAAERATSPTPPAVEPDEAQPEGAVAEQLSAADFRKVMLRANRTPAARACYRSHWEQTSDVDVIATVGAHGRVQKLRMGEGPLGECLRKVVLQLEFPRAARSAQHNFVFHRPDGE